MNTVTTLIPNLSTLPPAQRALQPERDATPHTFMLYGGTALALRLSHRTSVDFDFFLHRAMMHRFVAREKRGGLALCELREALGRET